MFFGRSLLALLFLPLGSTFCQELYKENFRPAFHFTPPRNWMNDPNGLVYLDGEYHLFYQHNPFGNRQGHLSWGHAVSKDLMHWEHLPLALPEEKEVMIFSGSVVVDEKNSSGFGGERGQIPLVAIYTGHIEGKSQSQHVAYSLDKGRTWKKYAKNPVLDLGKKDFRDPKVFWYPPQEKWVMAVALPIEKQVQFYESADLKKWDYMSSFGPAGDTTGIWECPDLFRVPVREKPGEFKWVLMLSPAPYMQYFIGDFDGRTFNWNNSGSGILRPDYGPDYYAAIVYNHLPEGSWPVSIGWANNWKYANEIPTIPWKGMMSLPRKLSILENINGPVMAQEPFDSFKNLRNNPPLALNQILKSGKSAFYFKGGLEMKIRLPVTGEGTSILKLGNGKNEVLIGFDAGKGLLYIDRSRSDDFTNREFRALHKYEAPVRVKNNQIELTLFYDQSLVEIFAEQGTTCMTLQVFPLRPYDRLGFQSSDNGQPEISFDAWTLRPVW